MIGCWCRGLILAAALFLSVPAAAQDVVPAATEADYAATVRRAVRDYLIPAYRALEMQTADLRKS